MKNLKTLIIVLFLLVPFMGISQFINNGSTTYTTDRVGIDKASASTQLHIEGYADKHIRLEEDGLGTEFFEIGVDNSGDLNFYRDNNSIAVAISDYSGNVGIGTSSPASLRRLDVRATKGIGTYSYTVDNTYAAVYATNGGNGPAAQFYKGDVKINLGDLQIGHTSVPAGYRMAVDGKILCEELKVLMSGSWPDYVFEEDYELLSLEEVEEYIQKEGHLHNTPSAQDVNADGGLEMGEVALNHQEKIEELFLHVIELNKSIKSLLEENQVLKTQIEGK